MFEPFILPQLACRYSCVCLKRWSLPWISSTLFHDYLGNLRARIWLLFSFPIPSIMTLKAFQGRKMRAFCFCLNEYFYCKPGNNQLCELCFKLKSFATEEDSYFFLPLFGLSVERFNIFYSTKTNHFLWWDSFFPFTAWACWKKIKGQSMPAERWIHPLLSKQSYCVLAKSSLHWILHWTRVASSNKSVCWTST